MKLTSSAKFPDVDTLAAVIARSPIVVVPSPAPDSRRFPPGFDEMDIAILDWIAAEGRRAGRQLLRI
jgi:hypothetical protein